MGTRKLIRARKTIQITSLAVLVLSALAMGVAVVVGEAEVGLYRLALTVWLIAATAFIAARTGVTSAVLEVIRQSAYDSGYEDGRRVARPVVVERLREVS